MRVFHWVLGASFLTLSAEAGTAPPEYWHMSSAEKRDFHVSQGLEFPHRFGQPGTIRQVCTQGMALMGMVSKAYMTRTIEDRSGYPDDWWRYFFGKAVHTFGPMAPGEITINKPIFDIEPGTYAVTLRYSLANAYLPRVPGGDFRPGLVVIIHRDGDSTAEAPKMTLRKLRAGETNKNSGDQQEERSERPEDKWTSAEKCL